LWHDPQVRHVSACHSDSGFWSDADISGHRLDDLACEGGALHLADACGGTERVIGEDLDDRPSLAIGPFSAYRDLIVDQAAIL
jgi:hypothetical protein